MKKNIFLLFSGSLLLLSGCSASVSVPYNGPELQVRQPEYPPVGSVRIAKVGEGLAEKAKVTLEKMLIVNKAIKIPDYTITATVYKQFGYDNTHNFFLPYGVEQTKSADPVEALSVEKKANAEICVITKHGNKSCAPGEYTKKDVGSDRGENTIKTLLYNGLKNSHTISLRYQEYADSTAKPIFASDITYDLSKSDTISYKGAEIKVLKADNTQIQYQLLHNFLTQ